MCGLFAGIGKLSSNRMIALGSMNEERGTDSVGLAYIFNNEMRIAKIAERPCVGLNITLRKEVTEAAVSGLFIGHTRQATQGGVTARNAHPFLEDGIAFAHNGIIFNDDTFGKYEVDSESLIHGIKARDFSKYEGPIALVWIEDGKLKAYRCGNPLYRGRHNGTTYLASEGDYLKEVGCTHVKELSEGMIYTFNTPVNISTERVKKNKSYSTSFAKQTYHPTPSYGSLEEYLEEKDKGATALSPAPSHGGRSFVERDGAIMELEEDFRTPSDIAKEFDSRFLDNCDYCGQMGELTEGVCLACITWMDDNNLTERDTPPAWLRGC